MDFRTPRERDWSTILSIANASVADVEGAGTQEEWLDNRRNFPPDGIQHHFVCTDSERVVGYGAAEHACNAPEGAYRLFVVTTPAKLATIGNGIFNELSILLTQLGAHNSWFVEYATDMRLTGFLIDRWYSEVRSFNLESGIAAVVLERQQSADATPLR